MNSGLVKVLLGAEYDDDLRGALIQSLKQLGAKPVDRSWTLVGSQELEVLEVDIDGIVICVESETFVGLTITGPSETIKRVQNAVSLLKSRP